MPSSNKLRYIILGIFDKRQHNRQYMRTIWRYLPGKSLKDWSAKNAIKYNHKYMITYFAELTEYFNKYKDKILINDDANDAAFYGNLDTIQILQKHDIYCTRPGANWAAQYGHLHVVQYLQNNQGIKCTSHGAHEAAANGYLNVVQYLHEHQDINCTSNGADLAAAYGHLDVIEYLEQHGIMCTTYGATWAAREQYSNIVEYLRQRGIISQY